VKYWEIITDNPSKAGWSWAVSQPWNPMGKRSRLLTRICDEGKRFVVRADEKLTAFMEIESAVEPFSAFSFL
jgi:hypothetical protein